MIQTVYVPKKKNVYLFQTLKTGEELVIMVIKLAAISTTATKNFSSSHTK